MPTELSRAAAAHRRVELHGLADIVPPVIGVERGVLDRLAGDAGDEGDRRRARHQHGEHLEQLLVERPHGRRMEGVVDAEALADDAPPAGEAQHRVDRRGRAGQRHALRRVDGADDHLRLGGGGDELAGLNRARHQEGHHAAAARLALQLAAPVDEMGGIGEAQRAGDVGGGDLADAVADDGRRHAAIRHQRAGDGDFQREDQRLGDLGGGKLGLVRRLAEGLGQRPAGERLEQRVDLLDGVAEGGARLPGGAAHAGILAAIAGEDEGDAGTGTARGAPQQGAFAGAAGDAAQLGRRIGVLERDGEAVRQPRPPMRGGMGEAFGGRLLLEAVGIGLGEGGEGLRVVRRDHQHRRGGERAARRQLMRLRQADDGVGIGAAEAEGGDSGHAGFGVERKRLGRGDEVERLEVDMLVQRVEMQRGRQLAPLQRVERLEHPGEAGGRLQMADVRLHRADRQGRGAPLADRRADGERLGGVADQRAGAVRLDEGEAVGVDAAPLVELFQQALLGAALRHGDAVGAPVRIGAARHHHRARRPAGGARKCRAG